MSKFKNWMLQAMGKSYWHQPLPLSSGFCMGDLSLYFIDNTSKTNWKGATDSQGIPLLPIDGKLTLFPTTIFQKTLGHWNLLTTLSLKQSQHGFDEKYQTEQFWCGANWALQNMDKSGGWKLPIKNCLYSAMTQGQGISVLVRAHKMSGKDKYLEAANRAFDLFRINVNEGGVIGEIDGLHTLEEFPNSNNFAILNGSIFALFGVYDLYISTRQPIYEEFFREHVTSIGLMLPRYDLGYWSRYDLSGNIASPFYHDLHISQLEALAIVEPNGLFKEFADKFSKYRNSRFCSAAAICTKISQKIFEREPEHGVQEI